MTKAESPPRLTDGLMLHAGGLALLLASAHYAWSWIERPSPALFWLTIAIPVAHQVFVWFAWRLELNARLVRRTIGFRWYLVVFFVLFISRFVALLALAWWDRGTLGLSVAARVALTLLLAAPGLYAAYSVKRYFGFARAAGADHFDPAYREMPLVTGGIFRYTQNGMYGVVFLLVWATAVAFDSSAALIAAAFSHAYIWVHYWATEKPDMRYLYGGE